MDDVHFDPIGPVEHLPAPMDKDGASWYRADDDGMSQGMKPVDLLVEEGKQVRKKARGRSSHCQRT